MSIDRRTSHAPRERDLLVSTVKDRTRIVRSDSFVQECLELLGWVTLMVDEQVALMKAPEWMV